MKKLFIIIGALTLAGSLRGQGVVNFGNLVGSGGSIVNAPIYNTNCAVKLEGTGFSSQLFAGPSGSSEASLAAVGAAVAFRTGAAAGYWFSTTRTIPGIAGGSPVVLQVRVWDNQGGTITTWNQAVASGATRGLSPLITVIATEGPMPPADMVGLQSICLNPLQMANAFASRAQIVANSGTVACNTTNFNRQAGEPNHCGSTNGASAWLSIQPTTNGLMAVNTDGSTFDTLLAVYTGSVLTNLVAVGCDDNSGLDGRDSQLMFPVSAGTNYQIMVEGAGGSSGTVVLNFANNQFPVISSIANQVGSEDTTMGPLAFTVADAETPATNLVVTGSSSNPTLVPNTNIVFSGTGTSRFVTITPAPNQSGTGVVTVVATDGGGAAANRMFTVAFAPVNDAPTVSLTSPTNGATFPANATINLSATASDVDGTVSKVEFFQENTKLGEDTGSPYNLGWTNVPQGSYALRAVVIDNLGASVTSAVANVTVGGGLIQAGAVWSYKDDGSDQGTAWRAVAFNDASWLSGPAQLGYGDGDEATLVGYGPDAANKFVTTYFRRKFFVANPAAYTNLLVRLKRDDGAIVYLNNAEIFRSNMPTGQVASTNFAFGAAADDGTNFFPKSVNPALLVAGNNVVAVEMHQSDRTSSDVSFDFELIANYAPAPPAVSIVSPTNGQAIASSTVNIIANASDSDDEQVAQVEFHEGNNLLGSDTTPTFSFAWTGVSTGAHALHAVAVDTSGLRATSAVVNITVTAPLQTVVAFGAGWKYLDNGTNLGAAWRSNSFDDGSWSVGPAQLGYGDGDEATLVGYGPNAGNKFVTTYFRHRFAVINPAAYTNLSLTLLHDDGGVVYLNGIEVLRANMPGGTISYTNLAPAALIDNATTTSNVNPALLVVGTNLLAVEIHQQSVSSTDLSFDLQLIGAANTAPPAITAQPQNQTVFLGGTADFSVAATGGPPLSYQWWRNGTNPVTGASNAVLTLNNANLSAVGSYHVIVANAFGSATSALAILTIIVPTNYLVINEFMATNATTLADPADGQFEDWIEIYNPNPFPVDLSGWFLTDTLADPTKWAFPNGAVISAGAYLLVWADNETLQTGLHANFSLNQSGEAVQLSAPNLDVVDRVIFDQQNGDVSLGRFPNATGPQVFMRQSTPGSVNLYSPRVFINEWMAANSVTLQDPADGQFEDWLELFNAEDVAVDLSGYRLSDTAPPVLASHWEFPSGTLIPARGYLLIWADNETNQTGLHARFQLAGGGETLTLGTSDLRVLDSVTFGIQTTDISEGRWSDGSASVVPMSRATPQAPNVCKPVITLQPQSAAVTLGGSADFTVEVSGTFPFTYQWRQGNADLGGQTNASLALANIQLTDIGLYSVRVENSAGFVISSNVQLTVQTPPSIVTQPASVTANLGSNVTFQVSAIGSDPLLFQWQLNGQNIPRATNSTLVIFNAQLTNGGAYTVAIANAVDAVTSEKAFLIFNLPQQLPGDNFSQRVFLTNANGVVAGSNVGATKETGETNHVGKAGGKSVWYTWQSPSNGVATFRTSGSPFDTLLAIYTGLSLSNLALVAADEDSGAYFTSEVRFNVVAGNVYHIAVDGLGGASGVFALEWKTELTAQPTPGILVQPRSLTVLRGTNALFSVQADTTNVSYQWTFNGLPITNAPATNATFIRTNVQAEHVGTYAVRVSNSFGRFILSQPVVLEIGPFPSRRSEDKLEDLFAEPPPGFAPAVDATSVSIGTIGAQILNNTGATKGLSETNHCAIIGGASRWYALKAGADATFVVDTQGTTVDTVLAAYVGSDPLTVRVVACNDNAYSGVKWSRLIFPATNGVEYSIAMDGVMASAGTLPLNWVLGHPPDHGVTSAGPAQSFLPAGQSLTLSTRLINGVPAARWQWYCDGSLIRDATNETIRVSAGGRGTAGTYSVVASNAIAVVTEVVAVVNVEIPLHLNVQWLQVPEDGVTNDYVLLTGTAEVGFEVLRSDDFTNSVGLHVNSQPTIPLGIREFVPTNSPPRFYWARPWP